METLAINNLYKFQLLPFKTDFFNKIYRLTGRAGKLGAIDQLLTIYPNCVLGVHAYGFEDGILYLEIHLIYYRICDGKITSNNIAYNCFSVSGDEFYTGCDTNTMFFGTDTPELYFLESPMPDFLKTADNAILDEQRINFNKNLENVETAEVNIEEPFMADDIKILDFIDLNEPLAPEILIKIESLTSLA